jgi:beta-glucanase (GH16 family)
LNTTCPPDPALGTSYTWNLSTNSILDSTWNITNGAVGYTDQAAQFSIAKPLDSPTIRSNFYLFFGRLEYHVQAAPGQGVVSSVVLQSDDLDEIDWEWIGTHNNQVQTNIYSQGRTIDNSSAYFTIEGDTTTSYHNYTTIWTQEKLEWWCDSKLLRTMLYADNTTIYPQTPMTMKIGAWPGGDPSGTPGRIAWAGGPINYDNGPYNMYVSQVQAHDYSSGVQYTYSGSSGSWQSIHVEK